MNRPGAYLKAVAFAAFFILLFSVHWETLRVPINQPDDIAAADYALYGHQKLWSPLLSNDLKAFMNFNAFPLQGGYMLVLRTSLNVFGIGYRSARLPPLLAGIAALALFVFLADAFGASLLTIIGLSLFGLDNYFFEVIHTTRPEGILWFVMVLNSCWLLRSGGPRSGAVCGLLATLALSFHSAFFYFLFSFPLLVWLCEYYQPSSPRRYVGWVLGACTGLCFLPHLVDIDRGMQFVTLVSHYPIPYILPAPIVRWGWNVVAIGKRAEEAMALQAQFGNQWHVAMVACLLTAMGWQISRWRHLDLYQKFAIVLGGSLLVSFSLFTPTNNVRYCFYFYPWMLVSFLAIAANRDRWKPTFYHWMIFDAFFGVLFSSFGPLQKIFTTALFGSTFFIQVTDFYKGWLRGLAGLGVAVFLLMFINRHGFELIGFIHYMLFYRPGFIAFLLFPWTVIWIVVLADRYRIDRPWHAWFFIATFIFSLQGGVVAITKRVHDSFLSPVFKAQMADFSPHQRMVAPGAFWLLNPDLNIQDPAGLRFAEGYGIKIDFGQALVAYHPDVVVWPCDNLRKITIFSRDSAIVETRSDWETPFGCYAVFEKRNPKPLFLSREVR